MPQRFQGALAQILSLTLASVVIGAGTAHAGCEPDLPARPVPQFDPALAPGVSLWPIDPDTGAVLLRPAKEFPGVTRAQVETLPAERDSTQYTSLSVPGIQYGHELFAEIAVPGRKDEAASLADWVVAIYTAGLSVWDLRMDPEEPRLKAQKDGWDDPVGPGHWAVFAGHGEQSYYVNAGDAVRDGDRLLIGVAASLNVGFSIWTFDTVTETLTQVYQDPLNIDGFDVSMVRDANGRVYAFASDRGIEGDNGGVHVYDVTAAAASGGLCVETLGSDACGVFRGEVGSIPWTDYVDVHVVNGTTYLAVADGLLQNRPVRMEIWEVADPSDPSGSATRRYAGQGLGSIVYSPQLFTYEGRAYIAFAENVGGIPHPDQVRVHEIDHCLDDDGCVSLGLPKVTETVLDNLTPDRQYLDLSFSEGVPFLHYGVDTTGLTGSGFEPDRIRRPSFTVRS